MCEEIFEVGFRLPLHPFIERFLARYGLVLAQIQLNAWKTIFNFMIKCAEVELEPRMRALRSILALKAGRSGKLIVYANYWSSALASLIFLVFS